MEDKDLEAPVPHKWIPETNLVRLAAMLKAIEENAELITALARCLMQGIDEREPVTGKINREWLEDELADAAAMNSLVAQLERLAVGRMQTRQTKKFNMKVTWLKMLGLKTLW